MIQGEWRDILHLTNTQRKEMESQKVHQSKAIRNYKLVLITSTGRIQIMLRVYVFKA